MIIGIVPKLISPGVHWFVTSFVAAGVGKADSQSTRFSTPILKAADGKKIADSSGIMRRLSESYLNLMVILYRTERGEPKVPR